MGKPSQKELEVAFCDEDTATWTGAAREIGRRARDKKPARAFIKHWLDKNPLESKSSDGEKETNIHRFRHACCSLAAFLSMPDTDESPFQEAVDRDIKNPLIRLCFESLSESGTVADLKVLGMVEEFEKWRTERLKSTRELVEKFEKSGKKQALEANKKRYQEIEKLDESSPVPDGFKPKAMRVIPGTSWTIASYLAGATSLKALLGLPLVLVVRGLLQAGTNQRTNGLPYVVGLPAFLIAVKKDADVAEWQSACDALADNLAPSWAADRLHYNDYIKALAEITESKTFLELWLNGITLPEWLASDLDRLDQLARSKEVSNELPRRSARLMRRIAREYFNDDWRFEELSFGERFSLNVFALLISEGVAPLAQANRSLPRLKLEHRIAILVETIESCREARDQVLPTLVRCLKMLLMTELLKSAKKATLVDVCHRQVAIARPLVAEWQLPGTLRKDLATVVCRNLIASYRADRTAFIDLLYSVLFALPDEMLFREMIEFSTEEEVTKTLRAIVAFVEHVHRLERKEIGLGDHSRPVAPSRAPSGENEEPALGLYHRCLEQLSHVAEGTTATELVDHLGDLVNYLSRNPVGREIEDHSSQEQALLRLLLAKQRSLQRWDAQLPRRRTDRKGAQWAAMEFARQTEMNARRTFDHFGRVLDNLQILESDCLPESGRPRPSGDLARRWRRLIMQLDELSVLVSNELPYLERTLCSRMLRRRTDELEHRLSALMRVLEKEEEEEAVRMLENKVAASKAGAIEFVRDDASMVQEWMLDRYMIKELARVLNLKVLRLLTSPLFVGFWIFSPFAACVVLQQSKLYAWRGVPFAVVTILSVFLILWYFIESKSAPVAAAATGRFLLPQITAALFLGIMEVLGNDEAWSLAVLEYTWVRLFTVAAFLLAGFFFTREVLLGGQLKGTGDIKKKNRRAMTVMSLVLWQSFLLVAVFGMLGGRVMGTRAELEPQQLIEVAGAYAQWLPHEVHLGAWVFQPTDSNDPFPQNPAYRIFPWALLTWTVQVFFFSAVFERIMQRTSSEN